MQQQADVPRSDKISFVALGPFEVPVDYVAVPFLGPARTGVFRAANLGKSS